MKNVKGLRKVTALFAVFCLIMPIFVFAGCGSNSLKVTLSTEDGFLSVRPGESTQLVVTLKNKGKNDDAANAVYSITSGASYATLASTGLLTINSGTPAGSKVKVIAKLGSTKSNTLEITVDRIAVETITLSSTKQSILPGGFATLTVVTDPVNTTDIIEYLVTQGSDVAGISDGKVWVNSTATIGTVIKVKAFAGTVESNQLEFTVAEPTQAALSISLIDEITVDKYGASTNVLTAKVKDESFEDVSGQAVRFEIQSGDEFISISSSGYNCTINVLGHGSAVIRATLDNANWDTATVNAIKPPDDLDVKDVFSERQNIEYTVGNTKELPYSVDIYGTKVCQEIVYTFEKKEGEEFVKEDTAGEFATYSNGKIDFNTTGVIRVIAKSNSGSRVEATVSHDFTVNNGINVSTFAELKSELEGTTSPRLVNVVVLDKPAGYDGYELVPQGEGSIYGWGIINAQGDVTINGNNHRINLSRIEKRIEVFTDSPTFISIEPSSTQAYTVELNDLQIIGSINSPMDAYQPYFYNRAIKIGNQMDLVNERTIAPCYLTMNNVDISKVISGMRICHAVDSKISNTRVADCWSNGIEAVSSIITLENMTYGLCGASGIEATPEFCDKAGVGFNQNQSLTFAGQIESININNGSTGHLKAIAGQVGGNFGAFLKGACAAAGLTSAQTSNFLRPTGVGDEVEFQLVALVFNGDSVNTSQLVTGDAANSIISINQTSTTVINKTHQYLLIDLPMGIGKVLAKNWNYQV